MRDTGTSRGKLQRATLSGRLAARLRNDILAGRYRPGAQLLEIEIAAALGVSRGPLREAMQRLVQEGLLVSAPHRGVFVPKLSEDDVRDVFLVRGIVEGAAIRQVIGAERQAGIRDELLRIADRMQTALAGKRWSQGSDLDFAFHRALVDAAESPRLSRIYATVQAETRLCLRVMMAGYRRNEALADDHVRLAEEIGMGDAEAAVAELRRHFGDPVAVWRRAEARA